MMINGIPYGIIMQHTILGVLTLTVFVLMILIIVSFAINFGLVVYAFIKIVIGRSR